MIDQYLFNLQKYKYFSFSKIFVILQILEYFFLKKTKPIKSELLSKNVSSALFFINPFNKRIV